MKRYILLLAVLASGTAHAWGWNDCGYEKNIETTLNLDGSEQLSVLAGAGDLSIKGHSGTSEARISGRVCSSDEEWLNKADLVAEGGREAEIAVNLPEVSGWSLAGKHYIYMDLEIDVPDTVTLDVRDSSGDMTIAKTGPISIADSSGDIDLEDIRGGVTLEDSSGEIGLKGIEGDVLVRQDSSGDIYGRDIEGGVRVERDSSGDIRFRDISGDFTVERDSSGDITADGVGGDFRVLRDGSGEIHSSDVTGEVDVPSD